MKRGAKPRDVRPAQPLEFRSILRDIRNINDHESPLRLEHPGNLLDGTLWQESLFEQYARTQGLTVDQVRAKYESQVPLGRSCTYEDVCNTVVFLASEESSYFTGQALNVAGGQEMG